MLCKLTQQAYISGAAAPTSLAAGDQGMPTDSEGSDDAISAADRCDAIRRRAAAEDRTLYNTISGKNSIQSLHYHHMKHVRRWGHRSSSPCMVVSHRGARTVNCPHTALPSDYVQPMPLGYIASLSSSLLNCRSAFTACSTRPKGSADCCPYDPIYDYDSLVMLERLTAVFA